MKQPEITEERRLSCLMTQMSKSLPQSLFSTTEIQPYKKIWDGEVKISLQKFGRNLSIHKYQH